MEAAELTLELKRRASDLGFSLCGVTPAVSPLGGAKLDDWLAAGYAGEMQYLADRREAYSDPNRVLDGVRSVVMLAMNYRTSEPKPAGAGQGRVSRYAWGDADYHDVIHETLEALIEHMRPLALHAQFRGVVDTAPLMEREFAQLAGLGWIGKNTLLINRQTGSWFFLAALLTDLELTYDAAHETDHCGTCRACLDACPTDAFPHPYVLDASRCISYLTIELRSPIPNDLRSGIGDWLFGCDVCQDVCPWNSKVPASRDALFKPRPENDPVELATLFDLDDTAFRHRFRNTPLWRPKRRGLLRNAAIVLGNQRAVDAVCALSRGVNDEEPLVRGACAWALGQLAVTPAITALRQRWAIETDATVREEIELALAADHAAETSKLPAQ